MPGAVMRLVRLVMVAALLVPGVAWAQSATSGSIAGVVRYTTGAVLPGVTVEAAGPSLIEKVRTGTTGGMGQNANQDVGPGEITDPVRLSGFSHVRREGLELNTGVTLPVDAVLRLGSLEETITVSGASPAVDVQNVRTQNVLTREVLDVLPTARTIQGYAAVTVGATLTGAGASIHDVGGNKGEAYGTILIHGSRSDDGRLNFDGMRVNNMVSRGGGASRFWMVNQAAVQEVVVETSGMSAESETGGLAQNSVPKDGGNRFTAYVNTNGTNGNLQSTNLTDELRARGLTTSQNIKSVWDVGGGVGGPIKRATLWFYTAHRWWGSQEYLPGTYYNQTQGTPVYTPDLNRQGHTKFLNLDDSLRLTWHPVQKHKVTLGFSNQQVCFCNARGGGSGGAGAGTYSGESLGYYEFEPNRLTTATWSYTPTNSLLIEAGEAHLRNIEVLRRQPGVTANDTPITELSTGTPYNNTSSPPGPSSGITEGKGSDFSQHNERFSVSYITGSHAFKVGLFTLFGGVDWTHSEIAQSLVYRFNFGVPVQLVQYASPTGGRTNATLVGTYAQDQWTIKNLTLNLGVRFDHANANVPAQEVQATRFTPAFLSPAIDNVPNFKD